MLLIWEPGWYLTYHYWPTSYNTHIFEGTLYFVPPKNAEERLRQELAAVTFKEYALQDGNTLEATQTMLESRAVTQFPLNDQEILLRHLHKTARAYVADYAAGDGDARPDLERVLSKERRLCRSCPPTSLSWSRSPPGHSRPRPSDTPSACQARWMSCSSSTTLRSPDLTTPSRYLDKFDLAALPEDATRLLWLYYSLVNVSFPVEVWRQTEGARQRRGQHGHAGRAGHLSVAPRPRHQARRGSSTRQVREIRGTSLPVGAARRGRRSLLDADPRVGFAVVTESQLAR